jgi:hypothetical protein
VCPSPRRASTRWVSEGRDVYAQVALPWLNFAFGAVGGSLDAERSKCGVLVGRKQGGRV